MRIAIINNLSSGSTGTLSMGLCSFLRANGLDARFFFAFGGKPQKNAQRFSSLGFQRINRMLTLFGANRYAGVGGPTKKLLKMLDQFDPQIINLQCLNIGSANLKLLFEYIRRRRLPVIVTCHAFFYSTGNCGYPPNGCTNYLKMCAGCEHSFFASKSLFRRTKLNYRQMQKWFLGTNIQFVCVSDYVSRVTKASPLTSPFPVKTILNGIDTGIFNYRPVASKTDLRTRILFPCSDTKGKLKGFPFFLSLIDRLANRDDILFCFVGTMKPKIQKKNLLDLGPIRTREGMADAYRSCDLTIMLSKDETFGMPIAESLCCGTPVAFFQCGGCESITIAEHSRVFRHGDVDSLAEYILSREYLSVDKAAIAKDAKKKFDYSHVNQGYLDLIREMCHL